MRHPCASTAWLSAAAFCALTTMAARAERGVAQLLGRSRQPQSTRRSIRSTRTTSRRCASHGVGRLSTRTLAALDPKLQRPNNFRVTPLMIGRVLYSPNGVGLVEAFHPGTGKTLWVQEPPSVRKDCAATARAASRTGVGETTNGCSSFVARARWRSTPGPDARTRISAAAARSTCGRARTYRWTGAPQVCRDVVIVGSSMSDSPPRKEGDARRRAGVRRADRQAAVDVPRHSARRRIRRRDLERRSRGSTPGTPTSWSLISADDDLGYVYLPLTSPTSDMYGGHRPGDNLFSDSLVCVDCATGRRVWHYQLVHHDLWDYDLPAAPVLGDIRVDGRSIRAVVQVTKQGFAFVFDRVNGQPVWPIEERPVPQSNTPGEQTSPTQPFPTKPPPFERQGVTVDDLIDFTPELRAAALEIVKTLRDRAVVHTAVDQGRGPATRDDSACRARWAAPTGRAPRSIPTPACCTSSRSPVPSSPTSCRAIRRSPIWRWTRGTREYPPAPLGLPLLKPPYGRITAIDLNKGEHVWMVPNGDGPRDHPLLKPLNLPPLGNPGRSAPLVTKTLLFVGEGDSIMADPVACPRACRSRWRPAPAAGSSAPTTRRPARGVGNRVAGRHHRRADVVHVRRQAVSGGRHRRSDHPAEYVALACHDKQGEANHRAAGSPPVPQRPTSWQTFLKAHWGVIAGADFFTAEVWTWGRGRDGPSPIWLGPPPAQIPASGTTALGSCLGF